MEKVYTHRGILVGCDRRTSGFFKEYVHLRETKKYYITNDGFKYNKDSGKGAGNHPMYRLSNVRKLLEAK
ncbi:MAG TPA: hypothetical protein ENI08_00800 [Candidatus Dependentiae bacterium]|nr:hypothetical protein [Candidatus Dependentiae bacterium]